MAVATGCIVGNPPTRPESDTTGTGDSTPIRYYESFRLPNVRPGRLVDSPAGTVRALRVSLPPSDSTPNGGPGFWSPGSPTGYLNMETMGSPRFLADLRSHALLQRLRWTHRYQADSAPVILPSRSTYRVGVHKE